jgi:hypothetical protein
MACRAVYSIAIGHRHWQDELATIGLELNIEFDGISEYHGGIAWRGWQD